MSLIPSPQALGLWTDPAWNARNAQPGVFAVIMGVSHYRHLPNGSGPLQGATYNLQQLTLSARTAYNFFQWFKNDYRLAKKPPLWCWLLLAPSVNEQPAINTPDYADATFENCKYALHALHTQIQHLPAAAADQSRVLIFFSGHGMEDHGEKFLLPTDWANPTDPAAFQLALSVHNIHAAFDNLQLGERLCLYDACRTYDSQLDQRTTFIGNPLFDAPRHQTTIPSSNAEIYGAIKDGVAQQFSNPDPQHVGSVFGQALLETLKNPKFIPNDASIYALTIGTLYAEMQAYLTNLRMEYPSIEQRLEIIDSSGLIFTEIQHPPATPVATLLDAIISSMHFHDLQLGTWNLYETKLIPNPTNDTMWDIHVQLPPSKSGYLLKLNDEDQLFGLLLPTYPDKPIDIRVNVQLEALPSNQWRLRWVGVATDRDSVVLPSDQVIQTAYKNPVGSAPEETAQLLLRLNSYSAPCTVEALEQAYELGESLIHDNRLTAYRDAINALLDRFKPLYTRYKKGDSPYITFSTDPDSFYQILERLKGTLPPETAATPIAKAHPFQACRSFLNWAKEQWSWLPPSRATGTINTKPDPLPKIFIPLPLVQVQQKPQQQDYIPYKQSLEDFFEQQVANIADLKLPKSDVKPGITLLTGNADSGKTTFTRWLAVTTAYAILKELDDVATVTGLRLPLYVSVADLMPMIDHKPALYTLMPLYLLFDYYRNQLDSESFAVPRKCIEEGRSIIYIDGLDELHSEQFQTAFDMLKKLIQVCQTLGNAVFITCRPMLKAKLKTLPTAHWQLPPLTAFDWGALIERRLSHHLHNELPPESLVRLKSALCEVIDASDAFNMTIMPQIACRPGWITLLCNTLTQDQNQLANPFCLFDLLINQILKQLLVNKSLPTLDEIQLHYILATLAFCAMEIDPYNKGFLRDNLIEATAAKSKIDREIIQSLCNQLLTPYHNILQTTTDKKYYFTEPFIRVFLTAHYLAHDSANGKLFPALAVELSTTLHWHTPLVLAAYKRSLQRLPEVEQLISQLHKRHRSQTTAGAIESAERSLALADAITQTMDSVFKKQTPATQAHTLHQQLHESYHRVLYDDRYDEAVQTRIRAVQVLHPHTIDQASNHVPILQSFTSATYWCTIPANWIVYRGDDQRWYRCYVPRFRIARYLVTRAQWKDFDETEGQNRLQQPMTNISWYQAQAFCRWVESKYKLSVQLPSRIQWMLAARGASNRMYPWGNYNHTQRACVSDLVRAETPAVIGSFLAGASPYGVLDMAGNVYEWTNDRTARDRDRTKINPTDTMIICGGSWKRSLEEATCDSFAEQARDEPSDECGLRLIINSEE